MMRSWPRWARRAGGRANAEIELADLAEARWIVTPAGSLTPELVAEVFERNRLKPPKVVVTSFSVHLRTHLLAASEYVAVMPRSVLQANAEIFDLKALPVKLPVRRFPVALVTLKNRTLSPVAALFIKHLREQTGSSNSANLIHMPGLQACRLPALGLASVLLRSGPSAAVCWSARVT